LPDIKTTIFSTMSALANEHKAINLGQGFPDFQCDPGLIDLVTEAMKAGHNQYPSMTGTQHLREAIAHKTRMLYQANYDVDVEITVTAGATQAIMTSIMACVHAGDEVIVIEPAYDCYAPCIQLAGGIPRFVSMQIENGVFSIDWNEVAASISQKTKLIIINSPNNPTGMTLQQADLDALAAILRDTNILVISDEVYEHMVYDGERHLSVSSHAELAQRSFIISSFGKTFHVTGWKVGYVLAPKALMVEFRKVHQFNVFTVNTPMQFGLANYMKNAGSYHSLPEFYQQKRDRFAQGLIDTQFKLMKVGGTYFQCVDYSAISSLPELEFATWLTKEVGVAAIPISAFYHNQKQNSLVRFCFAKQESTLDSALKKLQQI
jgi:methionine aminotransferase